VGTESIIDYIKVKWLSGIEDILYDVPVNQNINIVEASTLSINDSSIESNIKIYPNPTDHILNLDSSITINRIEVFDALGKKVLTKQLNSNDSSINVSKLSTGFYVIKIAYISSIVVKKFYKS
jgi:hypothetical protein